MAGATEKKDEQGEPLRDTDGSRLETPSTATSSMSLGTEPKIDSPCSSAGQISSVTDVFDENSRTSDNFLSVPYGFQCKATYEHQKKLTDLMGVTYNGRMREFVILDTKGVTTWNKDAIGQQVNRAFSFPKYEYRIITNIVYAKKYNVYFALGKDFSLKVLNKDFKETCHVSSDLHSILFLLFNPVRDELITGGVGGTKVWSYKQVTEKTWTETLPMTNYRLVLKYELANVGGSWVKKVELDLQQQHLYCCSDTDLYAYDMDGNQIFNIDRAHTMSISGCAFSRTTRFLVTGSVDSEVKVWSLTGGLIHTFRGHSRAVSNVLLHPDNPSLVITCSLDGSVRLWSLDTMEPLYGLVVSTDGVIWMGLTEDRMLYLATLRGITVWSLNQVAHFWAQMRSKVTHLAQVKGQSKSTRILSVGEDNSVHLFCRKTHKNLSTVLPPPSMSPMQRVKGVAYNRVLSVVYLLISTKELWIYTARTDPACRVAVWDLLRIQESHLMAAAKENEEDGSESASPGKIGRGSTTMTGKKSDTHLANSEQSGNELICDCHCVCYLNSHAITWTEEGLSTPLQDNFLLLGLDDGRILFMDPVVQAKKYFQFRASKDAILDMAHDADHGCLLTRVGLGDVGLIQIWSLPHLEPLHEMYCPRDVTGYVRMGPNFITAHMSGAVIHQTLLPLEQSTPLNLRYKFAINDEDPVRPTIKAEHNGPIVAMAVCLARNVFVTASGDGMLKVWDATKLQLAEVMLDDSLGDLAFLNDSGDLLVSFRNHLFLIDRRRLNLPKETADVIDNMSETESQVYEDPAVSYEGVVENPDPINLTNYLVPFDIDLSEDFLQRGPSTPTPSDAGASGSVSDSEMSELSAAPTSLYLSPRSETPSQLSLIDLTLSPTHMLQDLATTAQRLTEPVGRPGRPRGALTDSEEEPELQFEFPHFGLSPGPTPSPSSISSIETPSSFGVSEGGESTPVTSDDEEKPQIGFKPLEPLPAELANILEKIETPKPIVQQGPRPTGRLQNFRIDSKSVLHDAAKQQAREVQKKVAEHFHSGGGGEGDCGGGVAVTNLELPEISKRGSRTKKKQKSATERNFTRGKARSNSTASSRSGPRKTPVLSSSDDDDDDDDDDGRPKNNRSRTMLHRPLAPRVGRRKLHLTKKSSIIDQPGQGKAGGLEAVATVMGETGDGLNEEDAELVLIAETASMAGSTTGSTTQRMPKNASLASLPDHRGLIGMTPSIGPATETPPHANQSSSRIPSHLQDAEAKDEEKDHRLSSTGARSSSVISTPHPDTEAKDEEENCRLSPADTKSFSVIHTHPDTEAKDEEHGCRLSPADSRSASVISTHHPDTEAKDDEEECRLSPSDGRSPSVSPASDPSINVPLTQTPSPVARTRDLTAFSPVSDAAESEFLTRDRSVNELTYPLPPEEGPSVAWGLEFNFQEMPRSDTPKSILKNSSGHADGRESIASSMRVAFHDTGSEQGYRLRVGADTPFTDTSTLGSDLPMSPLLGDPDSAEHRHDSELRMRMLGMSGDLRAVSPSMTSYSELETESMYTVPAPDESSWSLLQDIQGEEEDDRYIFRGRRAPASAAPGTRAPPASADEFQKMRPHTAHSLPTRTEDLEEHFNEAINQYSESPGVAGVPNIHSNPGTKFDNWHEKMIQRHQLLQMQKALRSRSVAEKRSELEREQKMRHQTFPGHTACYTPAEGMHTKSNRAFSVIKQMQRVQSAPSPMAALSRPSSRATSRGPNSRPATVATAGRPGSESRASSWQQPKTRPTTASGIENIEESKKTKDKRALGAAIPFRSVITPNPRPHKVVARGRSESETLIDLQQMDPRHPNSVPFRELTHTKSIPSKCSRYVLITHPRRGPTPVRPTPLEEHLILQRFPDRTYDWLGGHPHNPQIYHTAAFPPTANTATS